MIRLFSNKKLVMTMGCLVALYITWGTVYLSIRFALESFPPVMLSGMRYITSGSCFLVWTFIIKGDLALPTSKDMKWMVIVSFGMIVISGALLNISEVYVSSGVVAMILGSTPLWMVIAGWLFSHDGKPSQMVVIGLIGGFIGILLLAVSTGVGQSGSIFGILCVFGSLFGWVAGSLVSRQHRVSISLIKSLGFQMLMGGVFMVVLSYFIGEFDDFSFAELSLKSILSFIHLVTFGSLVGYTCYIWLLFNTPIHIAVSYAYVEPVFAVILGAIFADEYVDKFTFIACALIILSVFFVMRGKLKNKE